MTSKKILVVDDEEVTLQLLIKRLTHEGYKVIEARTGQEAVEKTKHHVPDLVLVDLMLPDFDGAEVVRAIREDLFLKEIPAIFFSSMINEEVPSQPQSIKVGTNLYPAIPKPIDFDNLLSAVREAVGG